MTLLESIKNEIMNDPDGIYANLTPKEIADAMNSPVRKIVLIEAKPVVEVAIIDAPTSTEVVTDAPVLRIINGIPAAPNIITEQEVIDALNLK